MKKRAMYLMNYVIQETRDSLAVGRFTADREM